MSETLPAGRACRVCADPRLDQIEADVARPGTNKRAVARKYGLGRMSLGRHVQAHLPTRMRRAAEAAKKAPAAQETLQKLADLNVLARGVFTRAYNDNNPGAAIGALRELRKIIEFEGRILGTVKEAGHQISIDFSVDPAALARMAGAFLSLQQREVANLPAAVPPIDTRLVSSPTLDELKENR